VGGSFDFNDITDEALEFVVFTNDGTFGTNDFSMQFLHFSGPAPTMLRWVAFTSLVGLTDPNAEFQGGPTLFGAAAAKSVVAVGAIDWTTPTTPEPTTALGGSLPFFFDSLGNRLASPEVRFKPEVAGPDGVMTSFFPAAAPGNIFFGASAAAPHVAGAVALLFSQQPSATRTLVVQHLQQTALNPAGAGVDPLVGAGMIQLEPLPAPPGPLPSDVFEVNETSDAATDLGRIQGPQTYMDLTIARHPNGLFDYDWFRWTAGFAGQFTATIAGTPGLELKLFTLDGITLVPLSSNSIPGLDPKSVGASVAAGQVLLVEVKGINTSFGVMEQGGYTLNVNLS
jgi:hypothetical protein